MITAPRLLFNANNQRTSLKKTPEHRSVRPYGRFHLLLMKMEAKLSPFLSCEHYPSKKLVGIWILPPLILFQSEVIKKQESDSVMVD